MFLLSVRSICAIQPPNECVTLAEQYNKGVVSRPIFANGGILLKRRLKGVRVSECLVMTCDIIADWVVV